jgi:hypothetical protein
MDDRATQGRARQLREAKRAQRARERTRGYELVQLKLPRATATKLRVAMRETDFADALDRLLDDLVITIADYPALTDITWNLAVSHIAARDAFAVYERNWRFVDERTVIPRERALIERLAARFGSGIIHA